MGRIASLDFVADWENVARLLFSPLFISDGILSQKAFTLDSDSNESYISVLRSFIPSFNEDMDGIKKEGNFLYGYALLNVGKVRNLEFSTFDNISLDVIPRNAGKRKSHAGIVTTIANRRVKGGSPQSAARLLVRMRLVQLAKDNIVSFS